MTSGKVLLLGVGFIGAMALGAAIGPSLTYREEAVVAPPPATVAPPAVETSPRPAPPRAKSPQRTTTTVVAKPVSTAELHRRLKPVLNQGADMSLAAEGFRSAEQFATVAHAARNTQVPFVLLKHRVLKEGQALAAAIRASKPDLDAVSEVRRAQAAARSDIAAAS